jgi:hypothetical protein
MQNVIADRGAYGDSIAGGFRYCMIAAPDCYLIEADFAGIEAVQTGWYARDEDYLRLARLGVHAFLSSHLLFDEGAIEFPADLSWSDADLRQFFDALKKMYPANYDAAKRGVHGTNYGQTPRGLQATHPKLFPTVRAAERVQEFYFTLAKSVKQFQAESRERAFKQGYLGGKDHPYRYVHRFYNVIQFRPVKGKPTGNVPVHRRPDGQGGYRNFTMHLGDDAKRAVAFYPQSTAAGNIKEAMLRLFVPGTENYIGDAFYGRTPLRAQIHDSLVLEVPKAKVDEVFEKLTLEMRRPINEQPLDWCDPVKAAQYGFGSHLTIDVEAKIGKNWAPYNDREQDDKGRALRLNLDGMKKRALAGLPENLASDIIIPFDLYDDELDEDDIRDLARLQDGEAGAGAGEVLGAAG